MNIQIMKIYSESFNNVRSHKGEWLRVACGPLILIALGTLIVAMSYLSGGSPFGFDEATKEIFFKGEVSAFFVTAHLFFGLALFVAFISLQINGLRYAVLQDGGDRLITLNLNMRFVKIVLYGLLVSILSGIYLGISAGILIGAHALVGSVALDIVIGILLGIYGFYLVFRIVLYQVAISVDKSEAIKTSWRLMKGNVLRLIGLLILIGLTLVLINVVGHLVLWLIAALLAFGGAVLGAFVLLLSILFSIFMFLLGWAVNSKAMGLVYLKLLKK